MPRAQGSGHSEGPLRPTASTSHLTLGPLRPALVLCRDVPKVPGPEPKQTSGHGRPDPQLPLALTSRWKSENKDEPDAIQKKCTFIMD